MNTLTTALVAIGAALLLAVQTVDPDSGSYEVVSPAERTVAFAGDPGTIDVTTEDLTTLVQQYCQVCHNDVMMTGNMSLTGFDVAAAPERAETAEGMIRKLRAGMMPPK
ncbi:uncharacterized protein METZ01_LOCUS375589, partial [marine metagenome]